MAYPDIIHIFKFVYNSICDIAVHMTVRQRAVILDGIPLFVPLQIVIIHALDVTVHPPPPIILPLFDLNLLLQDLSIPVPAGMALDISRHVNPIHPMARSAIFITNMVHPNIFLVGNILVILLLHLPNVSQFFQLDFKKKI